MKRPIENTNAPLSKELLEKAVNGKLSQQEAQALSQLMEKDPFVAEVLESVDKDNWAAIQRISDRSTSKVLSRHPNVGGRRRLGWLKWAALALLFVSGTFWWINKDKTKTPIVQDDKQEKAVVVEELHKEAELVKEVLTPDTIIEQPKELKEPVASSFGQVEVAEPQVSEATLEVVEQAPAEELDVEEIAVVEQVVEQEPVAPSAGKKYQRLEIVQAHVIGYRLIQEEVKRKKQKKNGQVGGKEKFKSNDPTAYQYPSFYGGRKGIERFALEHLADLNKLEYEYHKNTIAVDLVVSASGKISDIIIADGIHPEIDSAAIDIFKQMPKWESGNVDVICQITLTVN